MPQVTRTAQAEDDLVEILHSLAVLSPSAAERLRDEIDRAAALLAGSPRIGRQRPELAPDLRSRPVSRRYLIFYRITDGGIEIVRVLHGARNIGPEMFNTGTAD